jgi:hypothetical protein
VERALGEEEARRSLLWLSWHVRVSVALFAVAALVLALDTVGYDGPLWAAFGLSLIATTLGFVGTMALTSRLADPIARGSALAGAGLVGATCAGYVYLVTVGSMNLELGRIPLHTLGLLLLGGLVSLGVHARAIGRLTGRRVLALPTFVLAGLLGAAVGAELLGVIPSLPHLSIAFLLPLASHTASAVQARGALRRFVDEDCRPSPDGG